MNDVAFLEALLKIPSPSGEEEAVAEYLVTRMKALGFRAHRDDVGNAVGLAGDPQAERTIVLLGHMDTVPGFIPVRWRDDRLYGRGAVDAKGPLATFVLAAARAAPHLQGTRIVVIGAVEEEAGGRGAHHLARTMAPPCCTIIGEPSGWQGITLGYKGMLSMEYHLVQPGGHSAGQLPGPAEHAVTFWNRLMVHAELQNGGREGCFNTLDPALREFRTFRQGVEDGVEMNIVVRLPLDADLDALQARIRSWCNGARLEFTGQDPAFRAEKNTPPVRALLRAIRAEGGRPRFKLKTGTSDMNVVGPAWGCPMAAYGPGDSALDHTPEEHVVRGEFERGVAVLTEALTLLGRSAA
jgi:LysW-gamma-L-lysine carboxypeptidase